VMNMINALKANSYWENDKECIAHRLSDEKLPYLLSQGQTEYTFIIYYLTPAQSMGKAEFKLDPSLKEWHVRNGSDRRSSDYTDIINYILQSH
ncbi:MAG: hypothetical protein ACRDFB_09570, partial [Rhabdochlamydiaceae bacterium]